MNFGTYSFPKKSYDSDTGAASALAMTAGSAIAQGDVVCASLSGITPVQVPTMGTASTVLTPTLSTVDTYGAPAGVACATLTSGNTVVAYAGTSVIRFAQYTPAGALVGSITTIEAGTSTCISVAALPNGNFVVAYGPGSATVKFAQYTAANAIVGSIVTVDTVSLSTSEGISVTALTGGSFVVAYVVSATSCKFAQYTAANAIVGSIVTVGSVSGSTGVSVAGLTNGNFVVVYAGTGALISAAQYTAANAIVGSLFTVYATTPSYVAITAISSGGYVIAFSDATPAYRFNRYNSSNVQQGSTTLIEIMGTSSRGVAVTTLADGGWAIAYTAAGFVKYIRFTSGGGPASYGTAADYATLASGGAVGITAVGSLFLVAYSVTGTAVKVARVATQAVPYAGSPLQIDALPNIAQGVPNVVEVANAAAGGVSCAVNASGIWAVLYYAGGSIVKLALYNQYGIIQSFGSIVVETGVNTNGGGASICALPNGNFVVAYGVQGTSVKFAQYTALGEQVGAIVTVETANPSGGVSVTALPTGNFIVAYGINSTYVRFGQYSASNTLVGALTTVASISPSNPSVSVGTLLNGNFVVAYGEVAGSTYFAQFSPTNALVGSITTIEAIAPQNTSISGLQNGNFVVAWGSGAAPIKVAQYNANNALVGTITTIESLNNQNAISVTGLSGSSYVVAYGAASSYVKFAQYTSGNVLVGSITIIEATATQGCGISVTAFPSGMVGIAYAQNTTAVKSVVYSGTPKSLMGVAMSGGSAGQLIPVQYIGKDYKPGSVLLPAVFPPPALVIDHRSVGGIAANLAGNILLTKGFSA